MNNDRIWTLIASGSFQTLAEEPMDQGLMGVIARAWSHFGKGDVKKAAAELRGSLGSHLPEEIALLLKVHLATILLDGAEWDEAMRVLHPLVSQNQRVIGVDCHAGDLVRSILPLYGILSLMEDIEVDMSPLLNFYREHPEDCIVAGLGVGPEHRKALLVTGLYLSDMPRVAKGAVDGVNEAVLTPYRRAMMWGAVAVIARQKGDQDALERAMGKVGEVAPEMTRLLQPV